MYRKKSKKLIVIFLLLLSISLLFGGNISLADSGTVKTNPYGIEYGGSKAGEFTLNGKPAFCVDHSKTTPSDIYYEGNIFDNVNIRRVLYYGWKGPAQWSGFNGNKNKGIVVTTMTLDHYMNGSDKGIIQEFKNYIESKPDPNQKIWFTNNNLSTHLSSDKTKQVTDQTTVDGGNNITMKFTLDNDITLVCDNKGWRQTGGEVTVSKGNKIHFEAPLSKEGNFARNNISCGYAFNSILFTTSYGSGTYQRLTQYRIDPTPVTSFSIHFQKFLGSMEIQKKDASTGENLSGFKFRITRPNGTTFDTSETNSDGKVRIDNLEPGHYKVQEISGRSYYEISTDVKEGDVTAGGTYTVNFSDRQKLGVAELSKLSTYTNKLIAGSEFEIYVDTNENGKLDSNEPLASVFNDKNNNNLADSGEGLSKLSKISLSNVEYTIKGLPIGKYILKEVKAPANYHYDNQYTAFSVEYNKTVKVQVKNNPDLTTINITKKDTLTGEKLSNFKYRITRPNGTTFDTSETDKNGNVTITDLYPGTYKIQEISGKSIYKITSEIKTIYNDPGQSSSVTFEDEKKLGKLNITKLETYRNTKIAGAEFDLYFDANGNGKIDNGETIARHVVDKNDDNLANKGEVYENVPHIIFNTSNDYIITGLPQGNYILRETKTPQYYHFNNQDTAVSVKQSITNNITIKNYPDLGFVKIYKKDILTKEPVKGVKYELTYEDGKTKVYSEETDKDGYVKIDKLYPGFYTVREISTDKTFLLSTEEYTQEVKPGRGVTFNYFDEKKLGNLSIRKIASDVPIELAGAKFELYYDANGNGIIDNGETIAKHVIDDNKDNLGNEWEHYEVVPTIVVGKVQPYTISGLPVGKYILKEIQAPEHYIIDNVYTPVEITWDYSHTASALITNTPTPGIIRINKKDILTNEPLKGFRYKVIFADGSSIITDETNEEGYVEVPNLLHGYYRLEEYSGDGNYKLSGVVKYVEVKTGETTETTYYDEKKLGRLEITKIDSVTKKFLNGAEFELYYDANNNGIIDDNETIARHVVDKNNDNLGNKDEHYEDVPRIVISNGKPYLITGLPQGNYILKEVKVPKYYHIKTATTNVFVKFFDTAKVTIENIPDKVKIVVTKLDGDENTKLSGFTFNIYNDVNNDGKITLKDKIAKDINGKSLKDLVTDKDGKIEFTIYTKDAQNIIVKETKAIGHYTVGKDNIKVLDLTKESNKDNAKIDVTFKNFQNFELDLKKTTKEDSKVTGLKKGDGVPDTYFSICSVDKDGKIVDFAKDRNGKYLGTKMDLTFEDTSKNGTYYVFKTDKNGKVHVKDLMKGNYIVREVKSHPNFLNDSEDIKVTLNEQTPLKTPLEVFTNTPHKLDIHIEKKGLIQAQPNDVIRYDFPNISNRSNVKIYNFTWEDHLPYDYVKIQKLFTGTWNEKHTFRVYYKTNLKTEWTEFDGFDYDNQEQHLIDFDKLGLDNVNEYVTDFKLVFDKGVKPDYQATNAPFIFVKVDDDVKATDVWTNKTKDYGWDYDNEYVEDTDEWKTTSYHAELKITKFPGKVLPRTGSENGSIETFVISTLVLITLGFVIKFSKE